MKMKSDKLKQLCRMLGGRSWFKRIVRSLPDWYIFNFLISQFHYASGHGCFANVFNPATFNEKLLLKKISDRSDLKRYVTDKEKVKKYVADKIGGQFNVPIYDVIRNKEDVDGFEFPEQCCIKPTHLSGPVIFRRNGEEINRGKIKNWFDKDRFWWVRENNYKGLDRKVIVEKLLKDDSGGIPDDYKVYCFNGSPKLILIVCDRFGEEDKVFVDADFNYMRFTREGYDIRRSNLERPKNAELMLQVATDLSSEFEFVRVDVYNLKGNIYVGELTHWPENCQKPFCPEWANEYVGKFFDK